MLTPKPKRKEEEAGEEGERQELIKNTGMEELETRGAGNNYIHVPLPFFICHAHFIVSKKNIKNKLTIVAAPMKTKHNDKM